MKAVRDPAVIAAVSAYSDMHQSLLEDARKAEADRKPMTARKIRYQAAIVARAALSEVIDRVPRG